MIYSVQGLGFMFHRRLKVLIDLIFSLHNILFKDDQKVPVTVEFLNVENGKKKIIKVS